MKLEIVEINGDKKEYEPTPFLLINLNRENPEAAKLAGFKELGESDQKLLQIKLSEIKHARLIGEDGDVIKIFG